MRPVAFLFSGQGCQYAGMGLGLYEAHKVFRDAIDRCAELLKPLLELDIRELILQRAVSGHQRNTLRSAGIIRR